MVSDPVPLTLPPRVRLSEVSVRLWLPSATVEAKSVVAVPALTMLFAPRVVALFKVMFWLGVVRLAKSVVGPVKVNEPEPVAVWLPLTVMPPVPLVMKLVGCAQLL